MVFWATELKAGEKPMALDMRDGETLTVCTASLVTTQDNEAANVKIYAKMDQKAEYLLCVLDAKKEPSKSISINLDHQDDVTFVVKGNGTVHLTGFIEEDEDSESEAAEGSLAEEDMQAEVDKAARRGRSPGVTNK